MKRILTIISFFTVAAACTPDFGPGSGDAGQEKILLESVVISAKEVILKPGEVFYLWGRTVPDNADFDSVTWTSSDTGVATVNYEGTVCAIAEGSCTISLNVEGKTDDCLVTVSSSKE